MARRASSISRAATDENQPPTGNPVALPRKPSGLRQPTAGLSNRTNISRASPRLRNKEVKTAAAAQAVAIQVQLPTSDGATGDATMPPTPPCSQSPPSKQAAGPQASTRPSSSQSLLPPAPTRARRQSRSPSAIPANLAAAPLHSPQVLAARRRSSVSPANAPVTIKAPSARRKTLTSIPAPVKTKGTKLAATSSQSKLKPRTSTSISTAAKGRRSSLKRLPTPTETLEVPVSPNAGDSDGDDPLLLKGGEEMRGWGEGRPSIGGGGLGGQARRKSSGRSRSRSESTAREQSVSLERSAEPVLEEGEEQREQEWQWKDEDLLPLGSGTIEEDLPSDYEVPLPVEEDEREEELDLGGYEAPIDFGDASGFDFAPLQEQDSDVDSVADEGEVADFADEEEAQDERHDTPRQHARPHLDYALPNDLDDSYDLEYEVPIQPQSSSPVRAPHPSSPHSYPISRPSPFLSSASRPPLSATHAEPVAEASPSIAAVQLPLQPEPEAQFEDDEESQDEELVQQQSIESQADFEPKEEVDEDEQFLALVRSVSVEPAPPALAVAEEERPLPPLPREEWTRGPAFFRSSPSVSMSPVLSYPALSATSPDMSSRRGGPQEEEEEDEDEIVLAGEDSRIRSSSVAVEESLFLHRSVSASVASSRSRADSYASSIARQSAAGDESDASMSSPRPRSLAEVSMASPRRPLSITSVGPGDIHMSSPSPHRRSPASPHSVHSPSFAHRSPSLNRKLPATPPVESLVDGIVEAEVDAQMASPSPVRRTAPASADRLIGAGLVEMGKQTLQGLFGGASLGPARSKGKGRQISENGEEDGGLAAGARGTTAFVVETAAVVAAVSTVASVPAAAPQAATPAPAPAPAPAAAPATVAPLARDLNSQTSNFTPVPRPLNLPSTTHGRPSSSSLTRSILRRRPSHPTLPVVEISSTDPKAAARAAAILKVYHDYVEQGLEAPGDLLAEAGIRRSAIKSGRVGGGSVRKSRGEAPVEEEVSVAESELRELLQEAEEEVREGVERRAVSASAEPASSVVASTATASVAIVRGGATDTPTSSRFAMDGSSSRVASPQLSNSAAVDEDRAWTSAEWRRLELALVEEGRVARKRGHELVVEKVLRRFLDGEGLNREQCVGQWAWDTLVVRVGALQKRRYQDSVRRSSSRAPSSVTSSAAPDRAPKPIHRRRSLRDELREVNTETSNSPTGNERATSPVVKVEEEEDSGLATASSPDDSDDSNSEPDRDAEDDTFFERPRPAATLAPPVAATSQRSPSVDPITGAIRPPPALAGSRFAHLYDEPVEKPRLPSQSWLPPASEEPEEGDTTAELDNSYEEGTPEAVERQPSEAPSSARKIFSYLGNLVRRPSATPEPEMREIKNAFARTEQPFPASAPSTSDRRILPLPPSVRSAPSTSTSTPTVTLTPAPTATGRRRRSSGEGKVWSQINALEDAESSREEDARVIELLQSAGGAKRRASGGDLRGAATKAAPVYGGVGTPAPVAFVPSGTRSGDRPIGEKVKRWF